MHDREILPEGVKDCPVLHFLLVFDFISHFYQLFLVSCLFVDSYVLLADDHVNNVSYFPFMSIKKLVPYFCVLREGYYVIIWLIVRICVYKRLRTHLQWIVYFKKEKHGELGEGGAVDINCTACICRYGKMHMIFFVLH